MSRRPTDELVLAILPTSRGLAYVLFAAPLSPIDWGLKRIRGNDKNGDALAVIDRLCQALRPDTLVVEDPRTNSRRSKRVRRLHALIASYAAAENLALVRYSRATVRETFRHSGAITRYEIAQAIAALIPAFSHRMPRVRKLWHSEDPRLSLFDSASLALTHYAALPKEIEEPP